MPDGILAMAPITVSGKSHGQRPKKKVLAAVKTRKVELIIQGVTADEKRAHPATCILY